MAKSPIVAALAAVLLLAVSSAALGHSGGTHWTSAVTLRSAAVTCAKYTPAREKSMRRSESRALGARHAAEHAHARALGRQQSCTRTGKLKKSFIAKVRAASKRTGKRIKATGPPSDVGQWSSRMHIDVTGIHGTLLPTGKVLYFNYGPNETGIAAIWDPATGTSHRADPSTQENLWCAGQTQLADGRVLVVGGNIPKTGSEFRGLDSIYIFDPWTETWTLQGRMNEGRWYPTSTLLPNGQVVITSGLKRDGSGDINTDVNVFTPNPDPAGVGTITTVGQKSFNLYPRTYVIRDGRALVAGPQRGDVGLLNPTTWTWSSVPQLLGEHYYGTGVLLPDGPNGSSKVMAIGGDQQAGTEVLDAENLAAGWSSRAPLPQSRRNANSVLTPDGAIITIGGNGTDTFGDPRFDALRYDPAANTWTSLAAQAESRGYHSTALLLPDGRIVSAGDDGPAGGGGQSDEIEIFSPPYLFKGARPSILSAPDQVSYGAPFAIGTLDTDIAKAVLIAPGATTHANDMHQRLVPLSFSPATGGLTATAPATAGIAPPGYYLLFLVNSQGIPSVARFVKLATGTPPPPDTTPPTVSVSAPAAGATLTGTTPVNATAADNIGVAGVQFTLDGANLGAEDTSSPYSVSWNTTTATNGAHTLRAIARDAAGNTTTSSPVSVTVSNTGTPPPAGLVAAYGFEETSGTAVTDASPANNPGTIAGAAARTASGKIGRAIDFDGVNDYVSVADANSLDLTTGMTLEAWVQLDTVSSWRTTILKEKPGTLSYALYANSSSARPQGEIVTGTGAGTDRVAGDRPGAHRRHLDPPGPDLRQRPAAPLQERRPGGPDRLDRRHPGLGPAPADRRQHDLGRVPRRAHRRGAGLQPGPVGGRDHHRHDDPGRRRRPAAARHHRPDGERQLAGGRRQRGRHHSRQRDRLRQRRRGRGPVHPRRGEPGRRGHQRPLLGELEHHHRHQRHPRPAGGRPRRGRQRDHLGGRQRDRRQPGPRHHAAHGERERPGRRRHALGHHPGQRHRRRQRRRRRGPVHPRRRQPGRRGHQLAPTR